MKIREVFEYEVDTENIDEVFTIQDYIYCVDNMEKPFWNSWHKPKISKEELTFLD